MSDWYITDRPRRGMGAHSRLRRTAEGLLGPRLTTDVARRGAVLRATVRRSLTELGRRSTRDLDPLENAYRGERCIIIGNGPSLNRTDLRLLRNEHTFGLNRLYMMFEKLGFGTEFHVVVNQHVVEQCSDELLAVPGRLFSTWPNRHHLGSRDDAVFLQGIVGPVFSLDPRRGVWEGATVTYVAMQLAYFMGFNEVLLVGVDHRFATQGPAHKLVTTASQDTNHFDPNYFGKGFRWQLPDLETSEIAYRLARRAFERDGRRIIDCTVEGALKVFPRGDLAAYVQARPPKPT